jgi:membrane-bound metal-dependent hydrolase YbcI (DUF457 family)
MPFTPYHFGPGLFVGLLFLSFLDFPTFLIASVIVDVEPFLVLVFNLDYPLHGFFHSFLGGTIAALFLAGFMIAIRKYFTPIISFFKLEQDVSYKKILAASLLAVYIHILLDSPIYIDIKPFFPLDYNPFYRSTDLPGFTEMLICVWCYFGAFLVYIIRLVIYSKKRQKKI